ncbi:hypothetical protein CF336_g7248, partial [Tilletia laevis]
MSTFRMFAATLIAAVSLLTLVNALDVPASVFSIKDFKGADTRPVKNIYIFGDSYSGKLLTSIMLDTLCQDLVSSCTGFGRTDDPSAAPKSDSGESRRRC